MKKAKAPGPAGIAGLMILSMILSASCGLERTPGNWKHEVSADGALHKAVSNQGGQKVWIQCPPPAMGINRSMTSGTIQVDSSPAVYLNAEQISHHESEIASPEGGLESLIQQIYEGEYIKIRMKGISFRKRRETFNMHLKGFRKAWEKTSKACGL